MYNTELENHVRELFLKLRAGSGEIAAAALPYQEKSKRIEQYVTTELAAACEGYVVDVYTYLADKIKQEEYFKDTDHLYEFYQLNLRGKIFENYGFNLAGSPTLQKGIEFEETPVRRGAYFAAGAAAAVLAAGGALKYALAPASLPIESAVTAATGVVVPLWAIVAAAVAAAFTAYVVTVPLRNKSEYRRAVEMFLDELENEVFDWIISIEEFFCSEVRKLYAKDFSSDKEARA